MAVSRVNQSYQLDDTFTLFVPDMRGDHNMKFGVNYSRRTETFNNFGTANGQFNFDTDQPWSPNSLDLQPEFFTLRVGGPSGTDFDPIPVRQRDEIGRLERLVTDFLSYARPPGLEPDEVSARALLERCRDLLQVEAGKRGARLALDDASDGAPTRPWWGAPACA